MHISEKVKVFMGDLWDMPVDVDKYGCISTGFRLHASTWLPKRNSPWTEHYEMDLSHDGTLTKYNPRVA